MSTVPESLRRVLEAARSAGFLGPGPIEAHLIHAAGFAEVAEAALGHDPTAFADLGTGGGVPGLVLALRWTQAGAAFIDSNHKRGAGLRAAVDELGLGDRVDVVEARAELVGAAGPYREQFELVVARSFAAPAVTAEVGAGLVRVGGILVVSEPPDVDEARWPPAELAVLGLGPADRVARSGAHFVVARKLSATPDRYPRAVGRPAKRPLW